ncbi:hypothetical protein OHV05_27025 [Kitasatospora sp. NBC_00070]|uniref:hypothetical protein n=1 Tax=Kitasatospora sp. NBC_00070 TaxID=2975962 RepID=UPI0032471803
MSYRPRLRTAVIGTCAAALLAGSGLLALPAQAENLKAPAAVTDLRSTRPEQAVASFVGDYWQAVRDGAVMVFGESLTADKVREHYLSTELNDALTQWGFDHQVDPIFRKEALPKSYSWAEAGQADGNTKVVLTETWDDDTTTDVWYTVNTKDLTITGITDPS